MDRNFYDILGITEDEKNLNDNEFQKILNTKYKSLAKKWHPDRFATKSENEQKEAEEKFKEISEAYNVLSNNEKRKQYDFGNSGNDSDPFAGDDIFSFFRNMHGGNTQRVVKGQNVQIQVDITLEESYNGGEKEIYFNVLKTCRHCNGSGSENGKIESCPHCHGSGIIQNIQRHGNMQTIKAHPCPHCHGSGRKIVNPCPHCNGSGMENILEQEKIMIPKGVDSGNYFVINGKGCEAPKNKNGQTINGDLIVVFNVINNDFERDGDNLIKELELDIFDGLLGCTQKIKTIDGKEITINIPECTNHSHIFTIKEKGMPNMNNPHIVGDLKIIIKYKMPKSLTNKERELLKKIKK